MMPSWVVVVERKKYQYVWWRRWKPKGVNVAWAKAWLGHDIVHGRTIYREERGEEE